MPEIAEFLSEVRTSVDRYLDRTVPPAEVPPVSLHQAIRWSLFGGGKRIRPALVIAAADTFGQASDFAYGAAAAIELIHTYSLIHDDLPAMDDDDLRRGRLTCHRKFGEATAILAGDVMQTIAFQILADDDLLPPADRRRQIISLIASASTEMVIGQQLDLDAEGSVVAVERLEEMHRKKTGALIEASVICGGLIGDATGIEMEKLEQYANALGLLFQVTDDLLDVTGTTDTLGKTAGKDAAAAKATYPALLGMDESQRLAERLHGAAAAALGAIDRDTRLLQGLLQMVAERKS